MFTVHDISLMNDNQFSEICFHFPVIFCQYLTTWYLLLYIHPSALIGALFSGMAGDADQPGGQQGIPLQPRGPSQCYQGERQNIYKNKKNRKIFWKNLTSLSLHRMQFFSNLILSSSLCFALFFIFSLLCFVMFVFSMFLS